jgi:hypothetical protein
MSDEEGRNLLAGRLPQQAQRVGPASAGTAQLEAALKKLGRVRRARFLTRPDESIRKLGPPTT